MSGHPNENAQGARPVLRQLGYPERLVVGTIRQGLEDGHMSTAAEGAIFHACGIAYTAARDGFAGLVEVLAVAGRRRLVLHRPGRGGVSTDEISVLALIAAAQAGDRDHVEASVRWLVVPRRGGLDASGFARDEKDAQETVFPRRVR